MKFGRKGQVDQLVDLADRSPTKYDSGSVELDSNESPRLPLHLLIL